MVDQRIIRASAQQTLVNLVLRDGSSRRNDPMQQLSVMPVNCRLDRAGANTNHDDRRHSPVAWAQPVKGPIHDQTRNCSSAAPATSTPIK